MAVIDSLVVALGFEFKPKDLDKFKASLASTTKAVAGIAAAFTGATAALVAFTNSSTAATDEQGKLANKIGVAVGTLDALQTAGALAGDSAAGVGSALQSLSVKASEAARGSGSAVEALGILGITAFDVNGNVKNTAELMIELAGGLQRFGKAQQIELSEKLGLGAATQLLQTGPAAIRDTISALEDLGVTTKKDAAIASDFQDNMVLTKVILRNFSRFVVNTVAPVLNKIAKGIQAWFKSNREVIKQNMPRVLSLVAKGFRLLSLAVGFFIGLKLIATLGLAVKAMNSLFISILRIPVLLALLGVGFLLAFEDAKTFFEGGESFTGDLIRKFPGLEEKILLLAAAFATVYDLILLSIKGWGMLFEVITTSDFDDVKGFFESLPGIIGVLFSEAWQAVRDFIENVTKEIPVLGTIITSAFDFAETIGVFLKNTVAAIGNFFVAAAASIATGSLEPMKVWVSEVGAEIEHGFKVVKVVVSKFIKAVKAKIKELLLPVQPIIDEIIKIFETGFKFVSDTVNAFLDAIGFSKIVDSAKTAFDDVLTTVKDFVGSAKSLLEPVKDFFKKAFNIDDIKATIKLSKEDDSDPLIPKAVTTAVSETLSSIKVKIGEVTDVLWGGFLSVFDKVKSGLKTMFVGVFDGLKIAIKPLTLAVKPIVGFIKDIKNGIANIPAQIKRAVSAFMELLGVIKNLNLEQVTKFFKDFSDSAKAKVGEIKDLFGTIFDTAIEKSKELFSGIADKVKFAFGFGDDPETETVKKAESQQRSHASAPDNTTTNKTVFSRAVESTTSVIKNLVPAGKIAGLFGSLFGKSEVAEPQVISPATIEKIQQQQNISNITNATSTAGPSSQVNNNTFNIKIDGSSGDPKQLATQFSELLSRELEQTAKETNIPVRQ